MASYPSFNSMSLMLKSHDSLVGMHYPDIHSRIFVTSPNMKTLEGTRSFNHLPYFAEVHACAKAMAAAKSKQEDDSAEPDLDGQDDNNLDGCHASASPGALIYEEDKEQADFDLCDQDPDVLMFKESFACRGGSSDDEAAATPMPMTTTTTMSTALQLALDMELMTRWTLIYLCPLLLQGLSSSPSRSRSRSSLSAKLLTPPSRSFKVIKDNKDDDFLVRAFSCILASEDLQRALVSFLGYARSGLFSGLARLGNGSLVALGSLAKWVLLWSRTSWVGFLKTAGLTMIRKLIWHYYDIKTTSSYSLGNYVIM
ncbi:hypothetical protein BDP27DRAFT_1366998 [Rhodocollybia butyracea]|uniref:Uncharacterized protein n=1 Tax=Rhodocollybia butyracea TaxID=206335 RepID=A0A9P5PJV7_9AGAR|nr:hypothetical protein BDP27DRAFT_1366998 [Rhodocollybia butyracea]